MQTLVLNQGYEPLSIVSWQRAMKLYCLGKAELVEQYSDLPPLRSQYVTIEVPAVIRFTNRVRRNYQVVRFKREYLFGRDSYRCQYCFEHFPASKLTQDHVIPRSRGGRRRWENIVTACVPCNQRKGDRLPHEAGMTLRRKPRKPQWFSTLLSATLSGSVAPPEWQPYLASSTV